jgi:hypothetical protein
MAVVGRKGRGKKDCANDDEDYRKRMVERQVSAAEFCQQKQDTDRGDNRRTHQAANRTTAARATNSIAH